MDIWMPSKFVMTMAWKDRLERLEVYIKWLNLEICDPLSSLVTDNCLLKSMLGT